MVNFIFNGEYFLWLAFISAGLMVILPFFTTSKKRLQQINTLQCIFTVSALIMLIVAFIKNDFSFYYVTKHGNIYLPIQYKISAAWSGHEGSLLLWLSMLSFVLYLSFTKATFIANTLTNRAIVSTSGMVLFTTIGFSLFTSNPFLKSDFLAVNGSDLNPLLHDPALIFHPPMLFLGYVTTAPIFVIICASLFSKELDESWLYNHIQVWARISWIALTIGIALGSYWAYYELGWGGYWFWDPVENASLLPWFFCTALLHSVRQSVMRQWIVFFAVSTFLLSLLATFLVRSGILISVHSFASNNSRGVFLLGILFLLSFPSLTLMVWRIEALSVKSKKNRLHFFLSINQILFLVGGFTVLLGTLAPIAFHVFFQQSISVGAPYFNQMMAPLWAISLIFLTFMSWHKHAWKWSIGGLIITIPIFNELLANFTEQPIAIFLLGIVIICASVTLSKAQKKRVQLAHSGFFIMSIGIISSSYFSQVITVSADETKVINFSGYEIKLIQQTQSNNTVYQSFRIHFTAKAKGKSETLLSPEKRRYHIGKQVISETAILASTSHDLLISLGNIEEQSKGNWRIRLQYRPFIRWIWLGALIMAIAVMLNFRSEKKPKRHDD